MADNLAAVSLYRRMLLSQFAAEAYLDGFTGELKKMEIDVDND